MELVALKIKIGMRGNGEWKYPEFNRIQPQFRGNANWENFIDVYGGWCYDNVATHADIDEFSPESGVRIGCILVPEAFAMEAVEMFPETVSVCPEAEYESFYNDRVMVAAASEKIDTEAVNGLRAKYGQPTGLLDASVMSDEDKEMLDPEHPRAGITRNKKKTFADIKKQRALSLKTLD